MNKENIFNNIVSSKKYKNICNCTINRIIDEEIKKYKKEALVIKSVKNKLHQIHGTFLQEKDLKKVDEYINNNETDEILKLHTSTNERINFYNEFYKEIFNVTGNPKSIMDIACGFNPFSYKYMHIDTLEYYVYDINEDNISLLNKYFNKFNINGIAKSLDILCDIPDNKVDVTFLFKILPLIEQQRKDYTINIMNNINSEYIIVTFPTRSVTGKNKGMKEYYCDYFENLIKDNFKVLKAINFVNELVYIIKK